MVPDVVGSTPAIHPTYKFFNQLFILFVRWYEFLVETVTKYITPLCKIFKQLFTNKFITTTLKINNLQYSESYWFLYVSKINTYVSKKIQQFK